MVIGSTEEISTLMLAEHEGGCMKSSSISSLEAAKCLSKDDSVSVLLAGSGPSLQQAATHAASCHPLVSQDLASIVVDGDNGAVTRHIISTTIGGKNGEPKQIRRNIEAICYILLLFRHRTVSLHKVLEPLMPHVNALA